MKKYILGFILVSLTACHSTTESEITVDSTVIKTTVDSIKVIDSVKVDTIK